MIDLHAHILPGIDDGAKNLDDSVAIARWLVGQGVTDVVATPHYIDETFYTSTKVANQKLLKTLQSALTQENINLNLHLGNEIYISDNILGLLEAGKINTLANSKYLLVEVPLNDEYPNYKDYFRVLKERGYQVVLAHPERYAIIQSDFGIAKELHDLGVLFQCNIGSILGRYGKSAKKTVKKLAKDRLIFAFGSDAHRASRTDYITLAQHKFQKYYSPDELNTLLVKNPQKIIKN